MAILKYHGIGITAMAGAVPSHVVENLKYTEYFPEEQVKEVVDKIGIYQRRFADEYTCSSDLCFAAAQKLLYDNNINREEIGIGNNIIHPNKPGVDGYKVFIRQDGFPDFGNFVYL